MSFSNPSVLYLLILLVALIIVMINNNRKKKIIRSDFMSKHSFEILGNMSGREIPLFKSILIIPALFFIILALAGPRWGEKFENLKIKGAEMIFLLDSSFSMKAEDIKPNRFEVAKELILTIVENLKTDYTGLISFSGTASVRCPMTLDYEALKLLVNSTEINPPESQGTDFSEPLNLALKFGQITSNSNKIIFLITDGEDQENRWEKVLKILKKNNFIIFTIGIGVPSGAPIPIKDEDGNTLGWKKDNEGNIVKTVLNESILKKISTETGGKYFRLSNTSGIKKLIDILKSFERSILKKKIKSVKIERFHYPLTIGIILLLIEIILLEKKIKWKRE